MQRRFMRGAQQGRYPRRYAGVVLAVIIGCSLAVSGWVSMRERPWVGPVKPLEVVKDVMPARVAPQPDFGKLPLYFIENRG